MQSQTQMQFIVNAEESINKIKTKKIEEKYSETLSLFVLQTPKEFLLVLLPMLSNPQVQTTSSEKKIFIN